MSFRLKCAVITTRNRPDDYLDCLTSVVPQVHFVAVVSHMDESYVREHLPLIPFAIIPYLEDPPNISRMWNLGLECADDFAGEVDRPYDVAVLNDDVVLPSDWFERVTKAMRHQHAVAGCVHRSFDPRMAGYAFILDGDKRIRLDEQFEWWYGDTDLERRARQLGGVAFAPGPDVEHRHPNSTTVGVLADIAHKDKVRYLRKWGRHAT